LIIAVLLLMVASTSLFARTALLRHERDVSRMVFNDNLQLLDEVRKSSGALDDSVAKVSETADPVSSNKPYIVVSIEDHRLWYKQGNAVLFTAPVATGSGKVLDGSGNGQWKFETPRGRLVINAKEADPAWVPPDWHFVEQARKRGLGIVRLNRGQTIAANDGSQITVNGTDVVKRYPDGREVAIGAAKEGNEIIAGGNIIIPPYGTTQRKYMGVLGTHRLEMGDGYGIHGTDQPESIGKSASHGCVRLLNADIDKLYDMVAVGTPVYIY
jgi:lipoprotein-anchoring transpeptidase ErfK/SrfK